MTNQKTKEEQTAPEAPATVETSEAQPNPAEAGEPNAPNPPNAPNVGGEVKGAGPVQAMLRHLDYTDLPDGSTERQVVAVVANAAAEIAGILANQSGPEQTAGMRKLLEAADCFRRAAR